MQRIIVGIREDDRDVAGAAKVVEFLVAEALVPRFDCMAKLKAVELLGQQVDESGNVVGRELPPRRELPQDRPQLGPSAENPCAKNAGEPFARFGELGFA